MTKNPLLEELRKLRESSKYAIAEGTYSKLNGFKKYLHIERAVEKKLKSIITKASQANHAQLLLVCGNVGDGKSHILSHLHDELSDDIIRFAIHNDATESHNPHESSNETLYKLLSSFKDDQLEDSKDKIILAINLGTLSKFIEEFGDEFKTLRDYISSHRILDVDLIHEDEYHSESHFHHVNFTDYHLYTLTENGAISPVISTLLEKIVANEEDNSIYQAYLDYKLLNSERSFCPILYNYEFLFSENNRNIISQLIIKAIIQSKEIVSLRTLLNFVYDIIVPVDLSAVNETDYFKTVEKMNVADYLANLIPNYLFEHPELSSLFEKIENLDPKNLRDASTDDVLLTLINAERPLEIFSKYVDQKYLSEIEKKLSQTKVGSADLSGLFMRLNYFSNYYKSKYLRDPDFEQYLIWLFYYHNHHPKYIKEIYHLVEHAARHWNGDPKAGDKVIINVGKKQTQYRVFKDFEVIPALSNKGMNHDKVLHKFTQEFTLTFRINNDTELVKIHVDFSLFKILKRILKGYRPNKRDHNNFIYFVDAVNTLIKQNNSKAALYIDEVNIGKPVDYKFSRDAFSGFKFQVV